MEEDFHKKKTLYGISKKNDEDSSVVTVPPMIGPYKIESLLEKGGMSILYLGIHPDTKDPTTIKVLLPKFLTHPDVVQRFLNEAEIIAMTDHPNIVKLFGHGEWEGGLYIAMEYIHGISLRQALIQHPFSLKKALEIVIDIAYALCHLHTHGVIHRDLKPENILITDQGQVKVIDFGIAQLMTEKNTEDIPARQRLVGTPIYMSPEQREDPESVSYPSDIYSLGIITYELVLGKLSHGQIHLSLMPKGLQKILNKTLQPRPEDRYQDIVDFITDVSAYLNSPQIKKEKIAGDQLSEILDDLRKAQGILSPQTLPQWKEFEIDVASNKGLHIYGVYHDFFDFPDGSYGILMGESSAKGAAGIVHTAILSGMVHSLRQWTNKPKELASMLNKLIIEAGLEQIYALSYLILSPHDNKLKYLSCGYGSLWHIPLPETPAIKIPSNHLALGIDPDAEFKEIELPFESKGRLILSSFPSELSNDPIENELTDNLFQKILTECQQLSTQNFLNCTIRKAKLVFSRPLHERLFTLICISRKK